MKPIPVHVTCGNEPGDNAGLRFCSALRDAITRSPRYSETGQDRTEYSQFVIYISTVPSIVNGQAIGSGVGVALVMEKRGESEFRGLSEHHPQSSRTCTPALSQPLSRVQVPAWHRTLTISFYVLIVFQSYKRSVVLPRFAAFAAFIRTSAQQHCASRQPSHTAAHSGHQPAAQVFRHPRQDAYTLVIIPFCLT